MSIGLATRGYYTLTQTVLAADLTPPVVTIISTPVLPTDPLVVHIYDDMGLAFYHVTCLDHAEGPRLTVYDPDDNGFVHPFSGRSTLTGSGTSVDPYVFTIYRRGRWPTGIELSVRARAVDVGGNEEDQ